MGANDPLTSNINALITLANLATGEVDTNLSDAVHTLIDGYGQGGEESNVVVGTFVGTTEGAAMDIDIPYTGNGYPVSVMIYPSASAEAVFDSTIHQNAVAFYSSVKNGLSQSPAYSGGTDDKAKVLYRSKSSSSNASAMSDSSGITASIYDNVDATGSTNNVVKINSATKLSVYIIGSVGKGFLANTEYTYIVVYSEPNGNGQGGGGSNVVVGTFTGTTAGELLRVNTGYTGNGYPIAFIFAPTGGLSQNTVFDQTLARYATCVYTGFKSYVDTEPLYSSDVADGNKFSVVVVQKSSSSDPSAANLTNVSKDTVILDNVSETLNTALKSIAFRSNNQFDALIRSTKYGFIANIEYTYAIIYSDADTGGGGGGGSGNSGLILTWYDPEVVV